MFYGTEFSIPCAEFLTQNRTEDKISSFSRMKLSKNLLESSSSRLCEIQTLELHVLQCGCGKGELQKRTKQNNVYLYKSAVLCIFPNLLSFQQALRPVPGIAAALQPMGRWCPAAMCAFAAVRLGLFHRAKPQQLFFETPQYKRTKKKIPY